MIHKIHGETSYNIHKINNYHFDLGLLMMHRFVYDIQNINSNDNAAF